MSKGKDWFWGEYRHKDGAKISPTEKRVFSKLADNEEKNSRSSWMECAKKIASSNGFTLNRAEKKMVTRRKVSRKKKTAKKKRRK